MIDEKCSFCNNEADLFMVNDYLWRDFCIKNSVSQKSFVCSSCFEFRLGRKIRDRDLTFAPTNLFFWAKRSPRKLLLFVRLLNLLIDSKKFI